jgi:hypothetical protein
MQDLKEEDRMSARALPVWLAAATLCVSVMAVAPQGAAAVSGGAATSAGPTAASSSTDARWNAWVGCWRPESVDGVAPPSHVICVLPTDDDGVAIATIADGRVVSEQRIVADGTQRAVDEGGCKGYETASWSQDGRRVFLQSALNCGGDIERKSSGILALVSSGSYVDVQSVEVSGEHASRTVRYVALAPSETPSVVRDRLHVEELAQETARLRASAPLDIEDVVEATRVAGSQALEGLLVARRSGFTLNADQLRMLSSEGVAPSTVDVMVALTYPEHFEVAEEAPRAANVRDDWGMGMGMGRDRWGTSSISSCYNPILDRSLGYGYYDPYGYRYSRCGYRSYYSPYGYDSYGWGYGTGPVVVVQPAEEPDDVQGKAVKGRGYTRRGTSAGTNAGTARPRAAVPTTTRSAGKSSGTSSGATGSVRSGGSSSSSGKATGRTAKPRTGTGN